MKTIDLINALPIRDVMSRLGIAYSGKPRVRCFFHGSKDPDLYINNDKNFFYCFGASCGVAGGNFQLVQHYLKLRTYRDVYSWFENNYESIKSGFIPTEQLIKMSLRDVEYQEHADYSHIYNFILNNCPEVTLDNYLIKERFLDIQQVKNNNIKGVNPNTNYTKLLLNNFDLIDLLASGVLSISTKTNNPYFAFFANPYISPLYQGDKIVSMQSRNLPNPKYPKMPKYKFCKGRPKPQIYVPSQPKSDKYYVCEGVITALSYLTMNKPAIALLSGTFNESIIEELKPYKEAKLTLSPDMNGVEVMASLRILLNKNGFNIDHENHSYFREALKLGFTEKQMYEINFNDYNDVLKLINL